MSTTDTIASLIADKLGHDGSRFTTPGGNDIRDLCALGGARDYEHRGAEVSEFADGSAIIIMGDAWYTDADIGAEPDVGEVLSAVRAMRS